MRSVLTNDRAHAFTIITRQVRTRRSPTYPIICFGLWMLCLTLLGAWTVRAATANPQVVPGSTITLTPSTSQSTPGGWGVYNPAGTLIAAAGLQSPGTNGWTVTATTTVINNIPSITSITVTVPSTAVMGIGHLVAYNGPGTTNAALFDVTAPTAPMGLSATGGNQFVSLSWTSSGASSYSIYRGTSAGGESGTAIATGLTSSSYTNTGLTNGTKYYYFVKAVNGSGTSLASNEVFFTPTLIVPTMPTNLTATPGNAQVALTWTAVNGATGYQVFRGTVSGGESATAIASPTATSYTNTGLTNGTTYYYTVKATNGAGSGSSSSEASAKPVSPPAAPTGLTATPGNAQVSLSWTASAGAASYNLKRSTTSGGPYTTVTSPTAPNATDTGLTNGTTYYYVVTAVNGSGESAASSQVSAVPTSALPATNLSAQAYSSTQVNLTWNSITGATSYNLYRSTTAGGEGSTPFLTGLTQQGPIPTYPNTGLTSGTTYYYKLSAVGSSGEGAKSNEASATPGSTLLSAPRLKAVAGNAQVVLTWSSVSGATSYNLYRSTQGNPYLTLYKVGLTGSTFTNIGLINGTQYTYYMKAVAAQGEGTASSSVSATPGSVALSAPNLSAQAYSSTQVNLTWSSVSGAVTYNIYRSTTAGGEGSAPFLTGIMQLGNIPTYSDTGLTSGTTYYYKISAVSPSGEGALSNEASATPGVAKLPAPTLTATADPARVAIAVSWTTVSGATSYNLYRSAGLGFAPSLYVSGLTSTTYTDTNLLPSGIAAYSVTAVKKDGEGAASNTVSARVNGFYLTCPASVPVARGNTVAVNVALTPIGAFASNVLLSGSGLPGGTQGQLYPLAPLVDSTVDIGYSITGNLYFNVGIATNPGSYPITVSGTSNGFTYSTSLTLMVQ